MKRVDDDGPRLNAQTYLPQTVTCLWENLPPVLLGAIFFSLGGMPFFVLAVLGSPWLALVAALLSMAPAWTALLWLEAELAQGRVANLARLPSAFRRYWVRSVRMGLVAVGPAALAAVFTELLWQVNSGLAVWVGVAGVSVGLVVFIVVLLYAFPMVALCDATASSALRNSIVLSSHHIVNTLGLAGMAVLMVLATIYVSLGLLLLWPAVYGLFVVNNCRLVLQSATEAVRHA